MRAGCAWGKAQKIPIHPNEFDFVGELWFWRSWIAKSLSSDPKALFLLFPLAYSTLSFHSGCLWFVSVLPGFYTKFSTSVRSLTPFHKNFHTVKNSWTFLPHLEQKQRKTHEDISFHETGIPHSGQLWLLSRRRGGWQRQLREALEAHPKAPSWLCIPKSSASIVRMGSSRVPSKNWVCSSQNAWGL